MEINEKTKPFLQEKKVKIVAVPRAGAMIEDPKHVGYYRYDGTKVGWVLPISRSRHTLYPILNNEEKEFFEKALDLDLNIYKKKDNFWHTFRVEIEKNDDFMARGLELDLSDPMDNLKYRLWKTCPFLAPSWEERTDRGEYILAIVDSDYQDVQRAVKSTKNIKAYKHLGKIEGSQTKLYDFLTIYSLQNPKAKRPNAEATTEALVAQSQDIIDNDINGYLAIAEDPEYDTKLLIHRAIAAGAIDKKYTTKEYYTPEGKLLGSSLDAVVKNIKDPDYQEDYLRIKAVVSATNKKAKE
jgi:hypothetical protein